MPLLRLSPNIQREMEMDSNGLKRSHDDFSGDEATIVDPRGLEAGVKQQATEGVIQANMALSPAQQITRESPDPQSSPASLTDADTSTPARRSPSPNPTPTKNTSPLKQTTDAKSVSTNPPAASSSANPSVQSSAKRKRRTASEKEAEDREKAQKKKERDEKKEAEEQEKALRKKEREAKQAEKAKADAEKQARIEEKRRKKEEEERKIQQEKEKKERAQPKLMSFFTKTPATPKKESVATSIKSESPAKAATTDSTEAAPAKTVERSEYEKRFKPFFVHETVRMARNAFDMDEDTRAVRCRILDEYLEGKREEVPAGSFDPVGVFHLVSRPAPRGRIYPPVKYTMERMRKLTQKAEGGSEEDKMAILKEATDALRKIPVKTLRFYQDVRPPYKGTVTIRPYQVGKDYMRRLARNPTLRDLMPINYDHDSEAEWESEGEDVDIEDDDDDDLDDGDGEMDEFLDDSEDTGPARFVSANGLEPVSTGLCWEDSKRKGPARTTHEHRMEFILESLENHSSVDPFSSKYWEPEPKPKAAAGRPKDKAAAAESCTPSNAFQAMGSTQNNAQALPKKILESNHLQELKKVIQANPKIAKSGLIDLSYVALAHAKVSRNDIKEAISAIAERNGRGQAGFWVVKPLYDV